MSKDCKQIHAVHERVQIRGHSSDPFVLPVRRRTMRGLWIFTPDGLELNLDKTRLPTYFYHEPAHQNNPTGQSSNCLKRD